MSAPLKSAATEARPKSKSLRATIPEGIVAFMGIESGDTLEWLMEVKGTERFAEVRKAKGAQKR